jgi:hypothetical protein
MTTRDGFLSKGAVEQDDPRQPGNTSLGGQLGHRDQDPLLKSHDTDFPEPGENAEHTGEQEGRDQKDQDTRFVSREPDPEAEQQNQDPGQRQKENQGEKKDDPLAA